MESRRLAFREVGEKILKSKCKKVDLNNITNDELQFISDLKLTFKETAGFGIAAPQLGVNKRIIIVGVNKEDCKYENAEDLKTTVMINPTWKKISDETNFEYEGCLSVPVVRGKVERYNNIELVYYNERGDKIKKQYFGFNARLLQHEIDHLDGVLFLEKVYNNEFATIDNIKKFKLK
jgi:peptide deformylase